MMNMPCVPVGVGMTCRSVLRGAAGAGYRLDFFASRFEPAPDEPYPVHTYIPGFVRRLPFGIARQFYENRMHRDYLHRIRDDQIAYLWPSVPLSVYEALARRGITIVSEAINTRMPVAKRILDAAYDTLGMPPLHGITEARIAEQEARYALSTTIFAPSPATEAALTGSPLDGRFVPTSYGTWVPERLPQRRRRRPTDPVTFLFIGAAGVRKGIHVLLEAWKKAPARAHLRIVGEVEMPIRKLYGDVLSAPNVSCAGFLPNVGPDLRAADVFILPSLEEGDPIVTYEAASHGLPVLATAVGGGRIGAETGCVVPIDAADPELLRATIADFTLSEEMRRHWGDRARQASLAYDWSLVAPRRFERLAEFLRRDGRLGG